MSSPALVLFDDQVARHWRPFTLTRPAGELLFGARTLRQRAELALGLQCGGHITADSLADFDEPWAPSVLAPHQVPRHPDGVLLLLSRFAADPTALPRGPALLVHDGRVVGARLMPDAAWPDDGFFLDPDGRPPDLPRQELPGTILDRVWELVTRSAERVARDLADLEESGLPPSVHRIGDHAVSLADGVSIAPGVVLDARDGPIRFDHGVTVQPFTEVVGPSYVGPGSSLLGGSFSAIAAGPRCKLHGEVEESVVLGYSNKAHEGFLGHAYLGMWVNLGAMTTNSDLKNTYGPVRVWSPNGDLDTGETKLGCFIGDHVKTAIGTLINTGSVIETGANVFGGVPPTYVPPFRWGRHGTYRPDAFLATARNVMSRRDVALTDRQARLLASALRAGGIDPGEDPAAAG